MTTHPLHALFRAGICLLSGLVLAPASGAAQSAVHQRPLTLVALGNAGEGGGMLRGNATILAAMGQNAHDAGPFDLLLFLGNSFGGVGLNVRSSRVEPEVARLTSSFDETLTRLGPDHVHGIPGNTDYYARFASEESFLFGLIRSQEQPTGYSERGNQRARELPWWRFHYTMPEVAQYALEPGAPDSLELIFFDSARLLRMDPSGWGPALARLRDLLRLSQRQGIRWRILCTFHPLFSAGEHAGYSEWNDEDSTVTYLSPCDHDSNAAGWMRNSLEATDQCAERYRRYADSLRAAVAAGGARVHLLLSAHERSLQLLAAPGATADMVPRVQVISGAASSTARARLSLPPLIFTAADPAREGLSAPGFVQVTCLHDHLRVVFFNGRNGDPLTMGADGTEFLIAPTGALMRPGAGSAH